MPADVKLLVNSVALFWLLPIACIAWRALHLKELRRGPKAWIAAILHEDPDLLWVRDEQVRLERTYQNLQSELISLRQSIVVDIQGSDIFEKKIIKLTHEKKQMEKRIRCEKSLKDGEERLTAISNELQQVQTGFEQYKQYLDQRRQSLTDKETEIQRAYTHKQLRIAQLRCEQAVDKAHKILALAEASTSQKVISRIEQKISRSESQIYASSFYDDAFVTFPVFAKTLESKNLDELPLAQLKTLLTVLEHAAEENYRVVERGIAFEKELLSNAHALEMEAKDWDKRADQYGDFSISDQKARKAAESRSYACKDMSHRLRTVVDGSKACTGELTRMHSEFARQEREILERILKFEKQAEK
jgi:hypothetical protein